MKKIFTLTALFLSALGFAQNYNGAESVDWDPVNSQWLISNGGEILTDDGNGNLGFFGNAQGSLGLEIMDNAVFAIQGATVRGYDLNTTAEVMSITIAGAGFLNGMASDSANKIIYVTDFSNNKIHAIDVTDLGNPIATEIVGNTGQTPNGVLYDEDNNRLLFVTWGNNARIKQVDLTDNSVSDVVSNTGVGNIDGIVYSESLDEYIISSWSPSRLTRYSSDFSTSSVVNSPAIPSPADIGIRQETNTIAVPIGNNVVFVELEVLNVQESLFKKINFSISENPVQATSIITLNLQNNISNVSMELYSVLGEKVKTIYHEDQVSGIVEAVLVNNNIASGLYLLKVSVNDQVSVQKVIFN